VTDPHDGDERGARGADLRKAVLDAIGAMARYEVSPLAEEADLVADLGFDSLRLIELSVVIQQRTGLPPLPLDSSLTITTVKDVLDLVAAHAGGQAR
jgi:acyl carrier protein